MKANTTTIGLFTKRLAAAVLGAIALTLAGCGSSGGGSGSGASPGGGAVIATVPTHHEVVRIDLARRAVTARAAVAVPGFVAQDPVRPRIYVGSASHDLVALDSTTLAEVARTTAMGVRDVAVAKDGSHIFTLAISGSSATLETRDPSTLETVASSAAPAGLAARAFYATGSLMTIDPSGRRLALVAPGVCWLVDATSFAGSTAASQSIALPVSFEPTDCAFSADGRTLFAGGHDRDRRDGRLLAIDVVLGGIEFVVDGGTAEYVAVAPSGSQAIVTGSFFGLSGVGSVDLDARALMSAIPDDRTHFPTDLALVAGGALVVAASNATDATGAGRIVLFDGRTLRVVGTVGGLPGPSGRVIAVR